MGIAFFDLDKTLIARNSAALWLRYELELGYISRRQALRAVTWLMRYHLGGVDLLHAIRRSIATLEGVPERQLQQRAQAFYQTRIRGLVRPGARQAVEAHRQRGERLVLLTSSPSYLSAAVIADLALHDYVATVLEVDAHGCFTGRPVEPICYGPGKVARARVFAQRYGVSLADCAFYSDSMSDLPMLKAVGRPGVVNPDPRLRWSARLRGWTILDWGEPDGVAGAFVSTR